MKGYPGQSGLSDPADAVPAEMERQMREDFAKLPDPGPEGVTARARKLIEYHMAHHGPIRNAESLIEEIASEMAVVQILSIRPR